MSSPELATVCCFAGCTERALWEIWGSGGFEDYTHACARHARELTPPDVTEVLPLSLEVERLEVNYVQYF